MKYTDIHGWFDFADVYDEVVAWAPQDSHFVEVGCWMGKSTAYLAQRIRESGKNISLDAVDTWAGSPGEPTHKRMLADLRRKKRTLYEVFRQNMQACGVADLIRPVQLPSVEGASRYEDGSLDFVFIDADHRYEAVLADVRAWLPKVRAGGILAGHDYPFPTVKRAVHEVLGEEKIEFKPPGSWVYSLEEPASG